MPLLARLNELEACGLIRLLQAQPDLEYLFRHALMQEVAYDSLIKSDRRTLHLAAGSALEELYPGDLESRDLAAILAWHFLEAGQVARALRYYTLAGDAAARVYANAEAIQHYSQALALAAGPQSAADRDLALRLYTRRGRAYELIGQFAEAERNYQELEALGARLADPQLQLEALGRRATLFAVPTASMDEAKGAELAQQALALARQLGDRAAEARSLWNLSNVAKFANRPAEAIEFGEAAIAIARAEGLREQLALALNDVFSNYWTQGQVGRAGEIVEEAAALWRDLSNLPMMADSLVNLGQIDLFLGRLAQAGEKFSEALRISRSIGNPWGQAYSLWTSGYLYIELAEYGRALTALRESIPAAHAAGFLVAQVLAPCAVAMLCADLGDLDSAFEIANQALEHANRTLPGHRAGPVGVLVQVHLMRGDLAAAAVVAAEAAGGAQGLRGDMIPQLTHVLLEMALAQGDFARVLRETEAFRRRLARMGGQVHVPSVQYFRGRAYAGLNQLPQARAAFEQGLALARQLGCRRAQWHLALDFWRLEREHGEASAAESLRREALDLTEFIASGLDDPSLRARFLGQARVQELYGGRQAA